MSDVVCPACSGFEAVKDVALRFRQLLPMQVYRCPTCAHRWAPTTTDEQARIEEKYAAHYDGFRVDTFFVHRIKQELAQRLEPISSSHARLLDVGCGNGEFLHAASQGGFRCTGIDVSPAAVQLCRSKGLEAFEGNFLSHAFSGKFDVITLWDVMEHLRAPAQFARRAGELLTSQGSLVLKIPSPGALNFQILRALPSRGGTLLGAPGHVQYFTQASLSRLLSQAGFRHLLWFENHHFRKPPETSNMRKRLARKLKTWVGRTARNQTLYVFAAKQVYSAELVARVSPRRVELLD